MNLEPFHVGPYILHFDENVFMFVTFVKCTGWPEKVTELDNIFYGFLFNSFVRHRPPGHIT